MTCQQIADLIGDASEAGVRKVLRRLAEQGLVIEQRVGRQYTYVGKSDFGLIIFRYDSDLFYANASRFVDDFDYSAGVSIAGLMDYLKARQVTFARWDWEGVGRQDAGHG